MNKGEKVDKTFYWVESNGDQVVIHFPDLPTDIGQIPLKTIVRSFTGMKLMSHISIKYLYYILGRFRWLDQLIQDFNQGLGSTDPYFLQFIKYQMMQAVSAFGYQVPAHTRLSVPGLRELLAEIEFKYEKEIKCYKTLIQEGAIIFDALQELYQPGLQVCGMTALGVPSCFRVKESYYLERKTVFGYERSFHVILQFIATLGHHFAVIEFENILSGWVGESNRKLKDLLFYPANQEQLSNFIASGKHYVKLGLGGPKFLLHSAECVFLHGQQATKSRSQVLNTSGRMVVDVIQGQLLGHHASHGMDDATHALIELTGRYKRYLNEQKSLGQQESLPEHLFLLKTIPDQLIQFAWPALVGFSFSAKSWCHVLVGGLSEIKYNDKAFDELVLDQGRKRLIKALVRFGGDQFEDIIQGKSGGSIFLLHGPAGVGKTLTAEAIAEVLHKPLYYVTMGELGTDPETMEKRLSEILELCASWNALTLIDEADVFLEKRATSDVLRNAMVCVMLRLLEYHQGILFLTTNRVTEFDPAFESRVTVALKYESLSKEARIKVWKNLLGRLSIEKGSIDYPKLGEYVLNGRQIKNAIRLAVALAMDEQKPVDQALLEETVAITSVGRAEMASAEKY